jgi:hypothetical protein
MDRQGSVKHRVLNHVHDADAGVYRLLVGAVVEETFLVPVLADDEVPLNGDGEPELETVNKEVVVATEDFVWAADDERWAGKTPEEIAQTQRRLIKELLTKRGEDDLVAPNAAELPKSVGKKL